MLRRLLRTAAPCSLAAALLGGCAEAPTSEETCGHPALDRALVVLERGDQTSALGRLAEGCFTETPSDVVLGYDNNLLEAKGDAFVAQNLEGTLRALDAAELRLGTTWEVYADQGASSDVHGIYGVDRDASGRLWVSRTDVGSLAIMEPGGGLSTTVDLADLDADDGVPDMNGILVAGDRAYVALGFLDFSKIPEPVVPRREGALVVLDATTGERLSTIDLRGHNPVHAPVRTGDPGVVLLATPGVYDEIDPADGVDRVWLDGSRDPEQIVDEVELGGSVDRVVWAADDEVYVIVLGAVPAINPTRVLRLDPTRPPGERVVRELARARYFDDHDAPAYVHVGLALAGDHLVVADQDPGRPRLVVFARADGAEVASIPTKVDFPPAALVALPP